MVSLYDTSEDVTIPWEKIRKNEKRLHGWPLKERKAHIDGRDLRSNLPDTPLYKGHHLHEGDLGKNHLVITATKDTLRAGFDVGDILHFTITSLEDPNDVRSISFTIVGMVDRVNETLSLDITSDNYAPIDAFPQDMPPENIGYMVDAEEEGLTEIHKKLVSIPGTFLLRVQALNEFVYKLTNQFSVMPMYMTLLALFVGSVVMANSVFLSVRQRIREIAVMKSLGISRKDVLVIIMLEYLLMGILCGIIGIVIGGGASLVVFKVLFGRAVEVYPIIPSLGIIVTSCLVSLAASFWSAFTVSGVKPLEALRYE
jgi:ABC-type antimicrobial peptide transport system permease subunit